MADSDVVEQKKGMILLTAFLALLYGICGYSLGRQGIVFSIGIALALFIIGGIWQGWFFALILVILGKGNKIIDNQSLLKHKKKK
ncbi:MAG: hypothetical protein WC263_05140, partial [Candidatus Micrarchaeia archaeon]|jgi:hypothetical protein